MVTQPHNISLASLIISKAWRKSQVIALLKAGKNPNLTKSCRIFPLLIRAFKLLERLLNPLIPYVEEQLIKQQAGFRSGKSNTDQLPNFTQHSED